MTNREPWRVSTKNGLDSVRRLAGVSLRGRWLSAKAIDAILEEIEVTPSASSEEVTFRSGTLTLHGYLWKPAGPGPFPAVLWNHQSWPTGDFNGSMQHFT